MSLLISAYNFLVHNTKRTLMHVKIEFPISAKQYMDYQCNGVVSDYTDCPELASVYSQIKKLRPKVVLELGAGLGRVSVYLKNALNWETTKFYLLDGDSGTVQIAGVHDTLQPHFYNSSLAAQEFCAANNIEPQNLVYVNAENSKCIGQLSGKAFDMCYSFKAIGFHWPITQYLTELADCIASNAHLYFELRTENPSAYTAERLLRIKRFNRRQLDSIDEDLYSIYTPNFLNQFPVLHLVRK